jgi:hypothetical protein
VELDAADKEGGVRAVLSGQSERVAPGGHRMRPLRSRHGASSATGLLIRLESAGTPDGLKTTPVRDFMNLPFVAL